MSGKKPLDFLGINICEGQDFKAMTAAVTDEMIDEIAITGTPDEVRQQMEQWQGLTETPLLYTPSIGMSPERSIENHALIAQTFAT